MISVARREGGPKLMKSIPHPSFRVTFDGLPNRGPPCLFQFSKGCHNLAVFRKAPLLLPAKVLRSPPSRGCHGRETSWVQLPSVLLVPHLCQIGGDGARKIQGAFTPVNSVGRPSTPVGASVGCHNCTEAVRQARFHRPTALGWNISA